MESLICLFYHLLLFSLLSCLESKDLHMICINKLKRDWAAFQTSCLMAKEMHCSALERAQARIRRTGLQPWLCQLTGFVSQGELFNFSGPVEI